MPESELSDRTLAEMIYSLSTEQLDSDFENVELAKQKNYE